MSSISCWEITLRECNSVSEVIEWYQTHNMGGWWGNQLHWADKTGDAVIVSPTPDNGLAFTRKTGEYLVSTNFNPVDHSQGWYPCQRYEYVSNRLEELTSEGIVSRQNLIPILSAVSLPETQEYIGTVYSNIFDLQSQTIPLQIVPKPLFFWRRREPVDKTSHGFEQGQERPCLGHLLRLVMLVTAKDLIASVT